MRGVRLQCGLYLGIQVQSVFPLLVDHGGMRLGCERVRHFYVPTTVGSRWQRRDTQDHPSLPCSRCMGCEPIRAIMHACCVLRRIWRELSFAPGFDSKCAFCVQASVMSIGDPGGHAWLEEQACSGLDVSPAQFRAALEVSDNLKLVNDFLSGGERCACVHACDFGCACADLHAAAWHRSPPIGC